MNEQVEMDCEPLDLTVKSRRADFRSLDLKHEKERIESDRLDSGLEPDLLRSGTESFTDKLLPDKFRRELSINSSTEEHCVSVDEGYSSESLKSGDLEKLKLSSSESWRPSKDNPPISEVTESENKTTDYTDSVDPYVEEVFTQDVEGDTQLHTAIINYLWQFAIYLISLVKDPDLLNIRNNFQQTSLHLAVLTKQPLLVRKLMSAGAHVDVPDRNGNTPLHLASREGNTLITKALVEPVTKEEQDEVEYEIPYVRIPQNLEARNYDGQVCLHLAAEGNHQEIMEVLIAKGAEINQRDGKSGRTVLHYAAESGNISLLEFLLQYPSLDINASTYGGQSPIMLAKGRGHNSVVRILKSARAQYDSSDESIEDEEMSEDSNEEVSVNGMSGMNGS